MVSSAVRRPMKVLIHRANTTSALSRVPSDYLLSARVSGEAGPYSIVTETTLFLPTYVRSKVCPFVSHGTRRVLPPPC